MLNAPFYDIWRELLVAESAYFVPNDVKYRFTETDMPSLYTYDKFKSYLDKFSHSIIAEGILDKINHILMNFLE